MKHKLKQSFWAPLHRPFRRSTTKHHARGARIALVTMLFAMTTSFVLPLLSPATASANADTMKNSIIVKKLAAYNTLLYCSTGFDKDIEGNSVGGFEWANNNGPMTYGYQSIDKGYREGSNDGSEDRDFIAIIKGNVDVTNFASFSGSYATNGADIGLCGSGNLQSVFKILSDGTSAQDLLCKLGYTQAGIKSLPRSSCALAAGKYDPSKDSFTISGNINTNAFKPSPLLTAAASHYVRQIMYFTGRDKGGCDASDASDGQYGAGYEIVQIYDYNGTSVGPYQWKKTAGCGVDSVLTNRGSQGIKDFLKAFDVELVSAAQTQCEALFPPSTAGGTVGEYENQVRNRKIAACVDGTKNKSAGYCELTYLGVSATADHEIQTEYEKKYGEEAAKELQNACLQGQGVDVSIDSTTPPSSDPCSIIPPDTPMSWLACSVFTAVSNITKGMEAQMTDILYSDADSMFKDNTTFKHASDIFRNISMALIVITGLVMIIAEASSLELFDAYTIKKVLPRLGIALVGMALSWPLLKLSVTLSNDVGFAVRDLFDKFAQTTAGGGSVSDAASGIGSVITTFLGGGLVVGALGIWGAILLGVSLLISYVTGIIVLFMQKLLLILIVLVAPIAIASSVLPGTEKLWKLWRSNLFKVLAMFTVIIAIIKVGDVAASVAFAANQPLMAFGAKIASLVLTFKAPQFTGQMLGGIMGMMSSAAYKMAGGLKAPVDKFRQQNTQQRNRELAEGNRFRNTTGMGRFANSVTRGAALIPKGIEKGGLLNPATFARHYQSANSQATFDKAEELRTKNADFMSGMQDDNVLWAILKGGKGGMAGIRKELAASGKSGAELEEAVRTAERMYNSGDHRAVMTAAAMHQATTGTGYKDVGQMLETIASASGGDVMLGQRMLGSMRGMASQSGRNDLGGAGFGATAGVLKKVYANGSNGEYKAEEGWTRMLQRDALNSVDANTLARQRGESARNLSAAAQEFIEASASNPTGLSLTEIEAGVNNANGDQISETFTVEGVQAAQARMAATLENLEAATRNYGATARAHEIHSVGMDGTATTREAMHTEQEYKDHIGTYNDPEYRRRAAMADEGK